MPNPELRHIAMSAPDVTTAEIEAVTQVLTGSRLSIGPRIVEFEQRVAEYVGARYAVAVSSGTAALHLAVVAAGVQEGEVVVTTPFSFVASANVVLYERAIPVFVDVDPATGNIDPKLLADVVEVLSDQPEERGWSLARIRRRTRGRGRLAAVLPVHVFGQPADMDPIVETAKRWKLAVIEDACEALGAEYKGRRLGASSGAPRTGLRSAATFAFYPNKQMTVGEGGMIVTGQDDWDALFRSLRNQGRDVFDGWLNHSRLGYNYRLDEMSAALGAVQIRRIEELLAKRERVAQWYNERLCDADALRIPDIVSSTTRMSWFVYVVRIAPGIDRNAVMLALAEQQIPSRPYFTPIHLQSYYRERFGYREGDFPITEALASTSLALPFSGVMTEDDVDCVCRALRDVLQRARGADTAVACGRTRS